MSSTHAVLSHGSLVSLRLSGHPAQTDTTTTVAETVAPGPKEPSALGVDPKELFVGLGAFLVLFFLLRYAFYPKVHGAMTARIEHVQTTLAEADSIRDAARKDVADYQADLAEVREEAAARVEAARQTVEAERAEKMTVVTARIAERRAEASAASDAAKAGAADQVASAVSDVTSQAATMVLGRTPDPSVVLAAVSSLMGSVK